MALFWLFLGLFYSEQKLCFFKEFPEYDINQQFDSNITLVSFDLTKDCGDVIYFQDAIICKNNFFYNVE